MVVASNSVPLESVEKTKEANKKKSRRLSHADTVLTKEGCVDILPSLLAKVHEEEETVPWPRIKVKVRTNHQYRCEHNDPTSVE